MLSEKEREKLIGLLKKTKKTDPIFICGEWEDKETIKDFNNVFLIPKEPSLFDVYGVKFLTGVEKPRDIIDKRIIRKDKPLNVFAIEEEPDIILSSEEKTYSKNYKGTTILSNNEKNKYFVVKLKSRDVEEKEI